MTDRNRETDRVGHPRPILQREAWTDLSGEWSFAFDDNDNGRGHGWPDSPDLLSGAIVVPYPPESPRSGIEDRSVHPVLWYGRWLTGHRPGPGRRLLLHFGAVDYAASVWVNGHLVAEHEGGHTPFTADVTDALSAADRHTLVVRVEDRADDPSQPRGKQDWLPEPHAIWYDRTSGVWQPVWTEEVPDLHIAALTWTADIDYARVRLDLSLSRQPERAILVRVTLRHAEQVLADIDVRVSHQHAGIDVDIPALRHGHHVGHLLWSPESPTLIAADINLGCGAPGADEGDRVHSYVGLRSVGFRDGQFLLNGKPYYLRMVLAQNFWPDSHLAAPDDAALRREVELVKELGFTGVRVHQKVEDPRFLTWCDRLGLLVWAEMAASYEFSERAVQRLTAEWTEAVRRDRSHPCVVTWVPLNESWGAPQMANNEAQQHLASAMYHLTKALDPSRPVISNDGWEHTTSDIWTVHDYAPDESSLRERYGDAAALRRTLRGSGPGRRKVLLLDGDERGQPVVVSEFGGLSFAPDKDESWFGYGVVASTDELLARVAGLVDALLDCPDVAGFCYTQLTDTQQERNGLLTADREPKLPLELLREVVTRPSRAIPSETVDAHRRAATARTD